MTLEDALANNQTRKMRMLSAGGDEDDDDNAETKTPAQKAKCMLQKLETQMDPKFDSFKAALKKRVEDAKKEIEEKGEYVYDHRDQIKENAEKKAENFKSHVQQGAKEAEAKAEQMKHNVQEHMKERENGGGRLLQAHHNMTNMTSHAQAQHAAAPQYTTTIHNR